MPDVNNMFPSNWMKVGDLQGGTIDGVVSHVVQEEIKAGEMLWVLHFQPNPQLPRASNGRDQDGVVLKTQNAEAIANTYGTSTESWAGQSIQLYVKQTNMGPGIGMRPVATVTTTPALVNRSHTSLIIVVFPVPASPVIGTIRRRISQASVMAACWHSVYSSILFP